MNSHVLMNKQTNNAVFHRRENGIFTHCFNFNPKEYFKINQGKSHIIMK